MLKVRVQCDRKKETFCQVRAIYSFHSRFEDIQIYLIGVLLMAGGKEGSSKLNEDNFVFQARDRGCY